MSTEKLISNAKPAAKVYGITCGRGLLLDIMPNGSKLWRYRFRYPPTAQGKPSRLSLGAYPATSLRQARDAAADARKLLDAGRNPAVERQLQKQVTVETHGTTLEAVARRWHANESRHWSPDYAECILSQLTRDVFPAIGGLPISEVKPLTLLPVIEAVRQRSAPTIAKRIQQTLSAIFEDALSMGHVEANYAHCLRKKFRVAPHVARLALPFAELPAFLTTLDASNADVQTKIAFRLLILTGVRVQEMAGAEWSEFDLEKAQWIIPAQRMKKVKRTQFQHLVPLSRQALALLEGLRPISGRRTHLFPNVNDPKRSMHQSTFMAACRRMGYRHEMTAHGFRSVFSTYLNQKGWPEAWIEFQLAHHKRSVAKIYNRAQYLADDNDPKPKREAMMQAWADAVDGTSRPSLYLVHKAA